MTTYLQELENSYGLETVEYKAVLVVQWHLSKVIDYIVVH